MIRFMRSIFIFHLSFFIFLNNDSKATYGRVVAVQLPLSALPNNARNLAEHHLDSDLSLGSDPELASHVPHLTPNPITGGEKSRTVRVSESQMSPTMFAFKLTFAKISPSKLH